nr:MAG TPA: hypothetical protein [Caudoviricetes sp.]
MFQRNVSVHRIQLPLTSDWQTCLVQELLLAAYFSSCPCNTL